MTLPAWHKSAQQERPAALAGTAVQSKPSHSESPYCCNARDFFVLQGAVLTARGEACLFHANLTSAHSSCVLQC